MRSVVSVIGAGSADDHQLATAERVGFLLASQDIVVVCGGLGGVMEAACRGAHEAGGTTIGILPGTDRAAASVHVDVVLPTGLGEARNVLVVRAGMALIAIGGGFGTLSELAFARMLGVPVIGLDTWRLPVSPSGIGLHRDRPGGRSVPTETSDDAVVHVADPDQAVRLAVDICRQDAY